MWAHKSSTVFLSTSVALDWPNPLSIRMFIGSITSLVEGQASEGVRVHLGVGFDEVGDPVDEVRLLEYA